MSKSISPVLLVLLAITVYLPALHAGFFIFDDFHLVKFLAESRPEFTDFWAQRQTGRYWRPLLGLSFLIDLHVWNLDASLMHLSNIILHSVNTLLVYALAKVFTKSINNVNDDFSVMAAALFAVHPINTESVNWISGRTDPLAALFILAATIMLIKGQSRRLAYYYLAALFALLGSLSKEVGFFFFGGAIVYLLVDSTETPISKIRASLPFILGGLIYLAMRSFALSGSDLGVTKISAQAGNNHHLHELHNVIASTGFYLKKLIIPTPLEFAIDEISTFFIYVGVVLLVFIYFIWARMKELRLIVIFLLTLIVPAVINALYKIAWTHYAERYLYISSAFLALLATVGFAKYCQQSKLHKIFLVFVFCVFSTVTIQRNLLWSDQEAFLEHAVQQNSTNTKLLNNYAIVLAGHDKPAAAIRVLESATSIDPLDTLAQDTLAKLKALK